MVAGVKMPGIGGGGEGVNVLSDFRTLDFSGPCGPCFVSLKIDMQSQYHVEKFCF